MADDRMVEFLRQLANDVESDTLTVTQRQHIGEFFMAYQSRKGECDPSEKDMLKYLTLGWWLYTQVIEK